MTGFLGADIEQLLEQSTIIRTSGEPLDELAEIQVTAGSSLAWVGPDADAFQDLLQSEVGGGLRESVGLRDFSSRTLAQHAAQQELTSDPDGRIGADDMPRTVEISVDEYDANLVMTGVGARPGEFGK